MKRSIILLVALVLVIAAAGVYIFSENQSNRKNQDGTHAYLGAIYVGTSKTTNYISANVSFQNGLNLPDNVYYVVLSIWDSNKSYDQLGIASIFGSFYSTYSYTTLENGTIQYHYAKKGWFPISPGNHWLSMSARNGTVTFTFDNTSFAADTGGNYFSMSSDETIGNHSYAGLTIYEEIYGFNKSFPRISYNFSNVVYQAGNTVGYITNWRQFSNNASNYTSYVYMKSNTINIYNGPSLTLKIDVEGLFSKAYLIISDLNFTIPGNGQYEVNLLNGNYTLYLVYLNKTKPVSVDLRTNNQSVSISA